MLAAVALFSELPMRPDGIEDRIWDMLVNCWAPNPVERPTAIGIISDLESYGISVPPASGLVDQPNNLDFPSFLLDGTEPLINQVCWPSFCV